MSTTIPKDTFDYQGGTIKNAALENVRPSGLRVVPLAFASTVTINTDVTDLANLATMTAAQTVTFSGTPTDGQRVFTHHQQDATGGRVLTPDSATAYFNDIGALTAANVPTAANAEWDMVWMFIGSVGKWKAVGIA